MKNKHLIFYDGECPLCNRMVRFLLSCDQKELFLFAPLEGETAAKELAHLKRDPQLDSLVLLQNYGEDHEKTLIEGKAVFRIFWILGGAYALIGWLSFLPSFLFDAFYRLIARYRYQLFKTKRAIPSDQSRRFLS